LALKPWVSLGLLDNQWLVVRFQNRLQAASLNKHKAEKSMRKFGFFQKEMEAIKIM
jgi:hypothetical protein